MTSGERIKLIREYELLRRMANELEMQSALVDRRLIELEFLLPKRYQYPGDVVPKAKR